MKGEYLMKILAIETSCDETCAAVVEDGKILSNIVSSQIELHKQWGGVVPSIAKRAHEEKIEFVVQEATKDVDEIDAIAVTRGPGLAIALEVGIRYAKELSAKWDKPLISVNHIEGHVLSALSPEVQFPAMALVVSGKHTDLIYVPQIGTYKIIAQTMDDALGEALDKAARMLGMGYPGGAEIEKAAASGNPKTYPLPLPLLGREDLNQFSYSGLKSAMYRLVQIQQPLTPDKANDLAASFQHTAFTHLTRVLSRSFKQFDTKDLLVGGGVAANQNLRHRLFELAESRGMQAHFPSKGLYGDNAAMIGIAAHFKAIRGEFSEPNSVDRLPRWRIDQVNVK
jgi:N6-L-threonylcarbamoyladenine synthase